MEAPHHNNNGLPPSPEFVAERESRLAEYAETVGADLSLPNHLPPPRPDRRRRGRTGVPPRVQADADGAGVEVLDCGEAAVTVKCPHCRGGRTVVFSALRRWRWQGHVPRCQGGRRGLVCRPDDGR